MIKLKKMYNALKRTEGTEPFFRDMVGAQVMVYDNRSDTGVDENESTIENCKDFFLNYKLNLPFECVWIETVTTSGVNLMSADGRAMVCDSIGVLIKEVSPGYFRCHYFFNASRSDSPNTSSNNYLAFGVEEGVLPPKFGTDKVEDTLLIIATTTTRKFLEAINSRSIYGVTEHNTVLKKGVGEKSLRTEISKVIHIRKKLSEKKAATEAPPMQAYDNKEIDWTHRWKVRGHWRKTEGIGKNRNGEYGTVGFTWVVEHIKGSESLPLIEKTRILHQI